MPAYNVSMKEQAPAEEYDKVKKHVTDQGGKITHEFKLIKGFTAEMPDNVFSTLQSNEHCDIEADKEVKTQ